MGKSDGKVVISTALNNKGLNKDLGNIAGSFGGLKSVVGKLGGVIAAAFSVRAIADFTKEAIALGSDLEEVQNVVDVSFGSMKSAAEEFAATAVTQFGMSELAAKRTSSTYMAMAKGLGVAEGAASDMAISLAGLSGDVASFYNLDQEAAAKKLQGVFTGESEALKELGVVMTQTNLKQFAMERGMNANVEAMSQAELVALRYAFVTDALSLAAGDFVRTQDSWANQTRILSMQWEQFMGIIGQTLTTVLTPAIQMLNNLVSVLITAAQKIQAVVSALFGKTASQTQAIAETAAAGAAAQEDLAAGVTKAGKAAKKSTAGFDELNVLQAGSDSSTQVGDTSDSKTVVTTSSTYVSDSPLNGVSETVDKVLETMEAILVLVGTTGAGILAWKILDAYTAGVSLAGILKSVKTLFTNIGSIALIVAGAVLLIKGYCDGWVNGVDWKNLLTTLGGIAIALTGIGIKFGTFGVSIGLVAAGIALVVLGMKDFIKNGPSLQNMILIIGGAAAVAVGLATAGVSVLVAAIIGAVTAVTAFTAALLLEEPAIMSVEEAQEQLTAAKEAAVAAENSYINAVDGAESAMNRLKDAEEAAGVTGAELYAQVQSGTLDYANMTDAQKEVYKAYLDNEKKQQDLKTATEEFNAAKKAETLASFENQLALAKESGSYDEFKQSVVAAFEAGEISAEEARDLLGKSMSEMSDSAQKTFMEDIPGAITDGLDPSQYETARKQIGDWFKQAGEDISTWWTDYFWKGITDWWSTKVQPIFTKQFWTDKFNALKDGAKAALNGLIDIVERSINGIINKINTFAIDIPDWEIFGDLGGKKFGFNFKPVSIPRLAQGAVIPPNREFMAVLGDQKHGTNVEAPLETIKQALAEVMATQGSGDITINFTGDLAQLARVLKPQIDRENRRVGSSLITKGAY